MAANFHVTINKKKDSLHLKLKGDFDGSSACELINILNASCSNIDEIFIHTDKLNSIHSFGVGVFNNNLPFKYKNSINFILQKNYPHKNIAIQNELAHQ